MPSKNSPTETTTGFPKPDLAAQTDHAKAEAKADARQIKDELKTAATEAKEEAVHAARSAVDSAKREGQRTIDAIRGEFRSLAHEQQAQLANGLFGIGQALDEAARNLEQERNPAFAAATRRAADYVHRVSDTVNGASPQALLSSTRETVREHPALFIGGAALLGFALGRFLRASERRGPGFDDQRTTLPPTQPPSHRRRTARPLVSHGYEQQLAPITATTVDSHLPPEPVEPTPRDAEI